MSYIDGYALAVPTDKIAAYTEMAQKAGVIWMKHGAVEYKECVGEDLADKGYGATFPDTVGVKVGETVVFSYIVFKSRAHRDEVNARVMADPELKDGCDPENMPFDIKRMSYGGFTPIVSFPS